MATDSPFKAPELLKAAMNALRLPDLRNKLLFTFGILVLFRFIAHVPLPGVNVEALRQIFEQNQLLGILDLFSGGALRNLSVAAMGVYPYITASIIMQLMQPIIPQLEQLQKEGEAGRNKINQYTHIMTVPLAFLQGYGQLAVLSQQGVISTFGLTGDNLLPTVSMVISMTAGTILLVWFGELITENGIGNGISILIFGGIVASLPTLIGQIFFGNAPLVGIILFGLIGLLTVLAIVFFQEATRRVPVHYAKRVRGNRIYGGQTTFIPLRVNSAGMIPIIFSTSIMILPSVIASYFEIAQTEWVAATARAVRGFFDPNAPFYWICFFLLTVGFTFFYTVVIFQQQNLAENLQRYGGFVQGIRPGKPTQEALTKILMRITWAGAVFLGIVAVLPFIVQRFTNVQALQLSSSGLLIVVGVVLDTMKQLEAQLMMRQYEGFIK